MSLALIRQSMCTAVKAISPIVNAELSFREYPNDAGDFADFCERNPAAVRRLFHVQGADDDRIESDNSSVHWVVTGAECAVAYPADFYAGDGALNDLEAMIRSDLRQLHETIGTPGYSTLENAVSGVVTTTGRRIVRGEACWFGVLVMDVEFWESTQ